MASAPVSPPGLLPLPLGGERPLCGPSQGPGLLTVSGDPWPRCPLLAGAPLCFVVSHRGCSLRPSLTQRGQALNGELALLCVLIKVRKPNPEKSGNLPQSLSKAGPPGLGRQLPASQHSRGWMGFPLAAAALEN